MQISRLFEIVYILLENKIVTASALSLRFEVSKRTIYRDIETLSQAGIPVYMSKGKGGGISLLPNFILNKSVLTEQEKTDILSSLQAVSAVNFSEKETLGKLRCLLGDTYADWIEVNFSSWSNTEKEAELFARLKDAVLQKRAVSFLYISSKCEQLQRAVLPLKLVFKGQAWYLFGYCKTRKDNRFFKLRRISDLSVSGEHFSMTAPEKLFPTDDFFTVNSVKATLRISSSMAFRVIDEIGEYTQLENGDFLCEIYLPDTQTICTYAATYGDTCEILGPESARQQMKEQLQKSLRHYL